MKRRAIRALLLLVVLLMAAWLLLPFQRWGWWELYKARDGDALTNLAQDITSQSDFDSIEIGQEGELAINGEAHPYDSYYFINGKAVTQHPRAGQMNGTEPIIGIDVYLEEHDLSPTRYDDFVRRMEALGIAGFDKTDAGLAFQVEVGSAFSGDNDITNLYYLPSGELTAEPQ